jgi:hypothetical protein
MAKTKISHPIDRHVGSRLRMRRVMLGMSQQKLGEAFAVARARDFARRFVTNDPSPKGT